MSRAHAAYGHARASLLVVFVSSGSSSLLLLSLLSLFNALSILSDLAGANARQRGAAVVNAMAEGTGIHATSCDLARLASLAASLVSLAALLLVLHAMIRYAQSVGASAGAATHGTSSLHEAVADILGLDADDDEDAVGWCGHRRGGVSDETIASLSISRVGADDAGKDGSGTHLGCGECPICITGFDDGDEVAELPCGHRYHRECIASWLCGHDTCPTCRARVELNSGSSSSLSRSLASLMSLISLSPTLLAAIPARRSPSPTPPPPLRP